METGASPEPGGHDTSTLQGLAALAVAVGEAQQALATAHKDIREIVQSQQGHITVLRRWVMVLGPVAGLLVVAVAMLLVVQLGMVAGVRGNQEDVARHQLAACGFHRGWVEIPALAAAAQASRSPGVTPTPNPYLDRLVALSRVAYDEGGCPSEYGDLPSPAVLPTPTTIPTGGG